MERTNFEKLKVYQLAERLADEIWTIISAWPNFAKDTVGKQLVRAADSIGANIAEGSRKANLLDQRRFVHIARGSLYETKHWLRRAFVRKLLTKAQTSTIKSLVDEITKTLSGYLTALTRRVHHTSADPSPKRSPKE